MQCTRAPRSIPEWVLPREEMQELYASGHGTAPDLIYARGVLDSPIPDPSSFNKKLCTLIIIEVGFYRDLGCVTKQEAKTKKYSALINALERHWGRVEFVVLPVGHCGTTLTTTLTHLTAAFSTVQPRVEPARASKGEPHPRHGQHRQGPRLHLIKVAARLHHGFSTIPSFSHYKQYETLSRFITKEGQPQPSTLGRSPSAQGNHSAGESYTHT
jgi:hypothetical protein